MTDTGDTGPVYADRPLAGADAMLFAAPGWGVEGDVAVVGDRVVANANEGSVAEVLRSDPVPVGTAVLDAWLPQQATGFASLGEDEVLISGPLEFVLAADASSVSDARLSYDDGDGFSGVFPGTGQLVEGDAVDIETMESGLIVVDGSRGGTVSDADATVDGIEDAVVAGDGDGDGYDDVVAMGDGYTTAYIFRGPLSGAYTLADADETVTPPSYLFYATVVGDVDGDGRADVGVDDGGEWKVCSLVGAFAEIAAFPDVGGTRGVGDVDGDGRADIIGYASDAVVLFRGPLSGSVEASSGQAFPLAEDARIDPIAAHGDLDSDGLSDFVLGRFAPDASYDRGHPGDEAWLVFYGANL